MTLQDVPTESLEHALPHLRKFKAGLYMEFARFDNEKKIEIVRSTLPEIEQELQHRKNPVVA